MNQQTPSIARSISLGIAASLILITNESICEEHTESIEQRPIHLYGKVAGQIGWDMAGLLDLGMLLGKPEASLQVSIRGLAGLSVDGDWPCQGVGGNLGYRGIWRVHPKLRITFMVGPLYLYRIAKNTLNQTKYRYHIPAATLALGLIFGRGKRLSHGVELSSDLGYAIQTAPDSASTDYSGFYGNGSVGYMLLL